MNIIFQAGTGVGAGDGLGAGAIGEQFFDQVHGVAHAARGGEGSKISRSIIGHLTSYVNSRELFIEVNF